MRRRFVLLILVIGTINISAQELEKAPKQISVELGFRSMLSNDLAGEGSQYGYGFLIDYAWQLSGFTGAKHPVYLSVPLGYTVLAENESVPGQRMLHYGWAVRHMIFKKNTFQPYLGYGLLLNQVSIDGRSGQLFGHQTRFAIGANYNNNSIITPYITLEYSMARHPQLDVEDSSWLRFIELKAGVRIK